jgi:hypothetical protein
VRLALTLILAVLILAQSGCGPLGGPPVAHSGIVGKWRSADGSYNVEFSPNGTCSGQIRLQGRYVGGVCTYTADQDTITIHYPDLASSPDAQRNGSAVWHYSLEGDILNVTVFGNSLALQRVP